MSGITPIPSTRISNQLSNNLLLEQLQANQKALLQLQQSISTGRRVILPSDDAPAAARAIDLQKLLERKDQVKTNLNINQSYLSATDSALSSITDLLNEARGVAVSGSGSTITDDQREAAAQQIDGMLQQLVDTANQQFNGRYLFAGSNTGARPFRLNGDFVEYNGNDTQLKSYSDIDLLFATNVTGNDVFGAISKLTPNAVDLNPIVTSNTSLADLNGGVGVGKGSIQVSDGSNVRIIDLSQAATLGDVKTLLEAQPSGVGPPALKVNITNYGLQVSLASGSGSLEIREVGGGNTARALGILAENNPAPIIAGSDLNPRLALTTRLADILGTRAKATITSPGVANDFQIEALQRGTAANGYTVQFVDSGTVTAGSETVNVSGTTVTVDIDSGHTTAAQVVQALNADPTFSALFHAQLDPDDPPGDQPVALAATATTAGGSGIEFDQTSGLEITNGTSTYTIDISGAKTVEDLAEPDQWRRRLVAGKNKFGWDRNRCSLALERRRFCNWRKRWPHRHAAWTTNLFEQHKTRRTESRPGVHTLAQQNIAGNDFGIQLEDGSTLHFRIGTQATIGDVINLINNAPGNGGKVLRS